MNRIIALLLLGFVSLSGFKPISVDSEQIAFDYFFETIFPNDFKNLETIEFKGQTEKRFFDVDDHTICFLGQERLQPLLESVMKGQRVDSKQIKSGHIKAVSFSDFTKSSKDAELYLYHSVRVADNFYVILSIQKSNESLTNYIFEIDGNGEILRTCSMAK
jgi:hypothetical protein